jgi:hypothetical protein
MVKLCNQWDKTDTIEVSHPEELAALGVAAVYTGSCGLCVECAAFCEFDGDGSAWTFERPDNAMCVCENCGARAYPC